MTNRNYFKTFSFPTDLRYVEGIRGEGYVRFWIEIGLV